MLQTPEVNLKYPPPKDDVMIKVEREVDRRVLGTWLCREAAREHTGRTSAFDQFCDFVLGGHAEAWIERELIGGNVIQIEEVPEHFFMIWQRWIVLWKRDPMFRLLCYWLHRQPVADSTAALEGIWYAQIISSPTLQAQPPHRIERMRRNELLPILDAIRNDEPFFARPPVTDERVRHTLYWLWEALFAPLFRICYRSV